MTPITAKLCLMAMQGEDTEVSTESTNDRRHFELAQALHFESVMTSHPCFRHSCGVRITGYTLVWLRTLRTSGLEIRG